MLSRNITEISKTFTLERQEDSDEFLNCLLNNLVKCLMSTELSLTVSRSYTTIDNLFRFEINSLVKCSICKRKTFNTEPYFIWNIPINSYTSLVSALNGFFQEENMSGDNAYKCDNCCKYVQASKTLSIRNVSPYLILSLKRFERFGLRQNDTRKLSHFVRYPEILDINPYLSDNIQEIPNGNNGSFSMNLRLYGVIVHIGQVDEGHLFSYVRGPNDNWYKVNDSTVTPVTLAEVLSSHDAYLLFYGETTSSVPSI
jgi:ubiquitin carboxyl-terminal hydrolase 36/42